MRFWVAIGRSPQNFSASENWLHASLAASHLLPKPAVPYR